MMESFIVDGQNIKPESSDERIAKIYEDLGASFWLKETLASALERDSLDALHDAEVLYEVLKLRFHENT